jgi:hypothetical protein
LPEYQGSLAPDHDHPRRLGVVRLATASKANGKRMASRGSEAFDSNLARAQMALGAVRLIATSLILVLIGALLYGIVTGPGDGQKGNLSSFLSRRDARPMATADGFPSEQGLLTLASLKLPATCLPLTHRPLSPEHAAEIASALANGSLGKLHCCTECHHAGAAQFKQVHLALTVERNCQACHRG